MNKMDCVVINPSDIKDGGISMCKVEYEMNKQTTYFNMSYHLEIKEIYGV